MNLREEFDRVWPMLAQAIAAYGPTHDREHVWCRIASGDAHLFPLPNAVLAVELKRWPTGFKEAVAWLAAGDLAEIKAFAPKLEAWAKAEGCSRAAVIAGRGGWGRALNGYRPTGAFLTKEL